MLFTFPIALSLIVRHPDKANYCPVSPSGEMVANRTIDGVLVRSGPSILARQFDGTKYKLTHLAGCDGPFRQLENNIGKSVQADFCGSSLIRVDLSGNLVFRSVPPSQEFLNKANTRGKMEGYVFIFIFLALVAWGVTGIRRKREAD